MTTARISSATSLSSDRLPLILESSLQASRLRFPIVGVGASAGGVEALQALFDSVAPNSGMAFVVITHLNAERKSVLGEILARHTEMPVHVADDGVRLQPDHVYVLAPGLSLTIEKGRLQTQPSGGRERKPIDVFFSALAKDAKEYAVGIVLSGGDGDGTLGAKAIKEWGGLTIAQEGGGTPPSHPDMPNSAISAGFVDLAVPVEEMGSRLVENFASVQVFETMAIEDHEAPGAGQDRAARDEIYDLLLGQTGHDFGGYKPKTFLRRIQRRMLACHLTSLPAYVERLRKDPGEVGALFRDLLINVTNFFRDHDAFEALEKLVVPALFEGKNAAGTVRVWVPGCAAGEEVFSLAILMREHLDGLRNRPRVQIFATDIDERALSVARSARYPATLLDDVSAERKARFFVADGPSYAVSKELREMCVFSPHSVLRDPPFSRIDLVSCRNLLIYFGNEAQNHVLPLFHYALRPGGFVFFGKSESIGQFGDLFRPLDAKNRIFVAREDSPVPRRLPMALAQLRSGRDVLSGKRIKDLPAIPLRQVVENHMLDRHAPPHVVVNREGDIVFYSARTGKYFEAPVGIPNRQLLQMARRGLRFDLRSALSGAVANDHAVRIDGVDFENGEGNVQRVSIVVEPLRNGSGEHLYCVILFDEQAPPAIDTVAPLDDDPTVHLERDLRDTRDRLQALVEEYETAIEELKASNEELVSVNEEMQSTNEELESSKEEQQSLNEELQTVNTELNSKIEALDQSYADLRNLIDVTDVATVFLDGDLRIRMFSPAAASIFKLRMSDRGRLLTDFSSRLFLPYLADELAEVRETGIPLGQQIDTVDGEEHYLVRISAYRQEDGTIGGVVVTAMDVTELAEAESRQRILVAELNHRVKNMLAIVQAIEHRTYTSSETLDAFHDAFAGRLAAMTRSYELLSLERWATINMADLVEREMAPFGMERIKVDGGALRLTPRQGLAIGMIMHELATNAVKHGALSGPAGRVELSWSETEANVRLRWREVDGPAVAEPMRRGFGLHLVERETHASLGGKAKIAFLPAGLSVDLQFKMVEAQGAA